MDAKVKIELTNDMAYVEISGTTKDVLRNFCLLFDKYPITKDLLKDAVKVHDMYLQDQEEKERQAKNN